MDNPGECLQQYLGLNALSGGPDWLGENPRGSRGLNILTGASEALMGCL